MKLEKKEQSNFFVDSTFQAFFERSSMPMIMLDVSEIKRKCEEMKRSDFMNIDSCISDELFINKYSFLYINIERINNAAAVLFRVRNTSDLIQKKSYVFNELYKKVSAFLIKKIIGNNDDSEFECKVSHVDGRIFYYQLYVDIIDNGGMVYAFLSIIENTRNKEYEFLAKNLEDKYNILLSSIEDAVIIVDIETDKVIESNKIACRLFGFLEKDIIGIDHYTLFIGSEQDKYKKFFSEEIHNEKNDSYLSIFLFDKKGQKNNLFVKITTSVIGDMNVAQIIFHNMNNRFRVEKRRGLLATALDQVAESIIITDIYGNIQYVNPAFENISGYSGEEVFGKSTRSFLSDDFPLYQYRLIWNELSRGNVWRGKLVNKKKNGDIYHEDATIAPVKDDEDQVVNYVAVNRDITQHLILESQIRQTQKMMAIGTLAGGVAHDFNNILTAILGYAELTQSLCERESLMYQNLEEIIRATDRAGEVVDQILKFSRQGGKDVANLKISLIIKEVMKLLRAALPATIDLIVEMSAEPYVKADPTQMHQIVMNLCTNAYQSLKGRGGGAIRISLGTCVLSPEEGVRIGNLPHGSYVYLQVEDNGVGIPKEFQQRIFEPYFTMRKDQQGTELGLSVVHGIVADHSGAITVDSSPGTGSTFTVYLPEAEEKEIPTQDQ